MVKKEKRKLLESQATEYIMEYNQELILGGKKKKKKNVHSTEDKAERKDTRRQALPIISYTVYLGRAFCC